MSSKQIPRFLLKGVDVNAVIFQYFAGEFVERKNPTEKITVTENFPLLAPAYGNDNTAPIFSVPDRNNARVIIATSGHSEFDVFMKTGGQLPVGGRCRFCQDEFTTAAVGYPLAYNEENILVSAPNERPRYRIHYVFWVESRFCSFECALGYVMMLLSRPAIYRDTSLRDSASMLRMLYKLTYPTAGPLRPAQNPDLLNAMTREEWNDRRHVFVRTDRVVIIPAKAEYMCQKFLDPTTYVNMP